MKWILLLVFLFATPANANEFGWVLKLPVLHMGVCINQNIPAPCAVHREENGTLYIVFIEKKMVRGYEPLSIYRINGKELELLWINPETLI